ncbi:1-acyl-sn-glycerol-3-phosphate acyltransferase [Olleya sp. AH-315-F22]|nr:1-acyl-sn-glycerol-3-phosphate acyltransferase [Olleya sp. AH-315-F22]
MKLGLFFYFKEIRLIGAKHIPRDKPVLILPNHQNALIDALLIATKCGRFSYFLTRADLFQKPFVSKLLKTLQMLPVYRIRDGWSNLRNNNSIFESCSDLLNQNEVVVVFPEGRHNLNRTVRPIKKGFTRIVFDTLEKYPNIDIQLIPVGINFSNAERFPDSTSIYFGKPIEAKSFVLGNRNEDVLNLKKNIQLEISKLTTHIPTEGYKETIKKLDALNVDYLNPKAVNKCIVNNFEDCKQKPKTNLNWLRSLLKGLLILNILPPYLIWKFIAQPKIKELEFTATLRFAIAITLVPIYLLIICFVLASVFTPTIGLAYVFFVLLLELSAVKL